MNDPLLGPGIFAVYLSLAARIFSGASDFIPIEAGYEYIITPWLACGYSYDIHTNSCSSFRSVYPAGILICILNFSRIICSSDATLNLRAYASALSRSLLSSTSTNFVRFLLTYSVKALSDGPCSVSIICGVACTLYCTATAVESICGDITHLRIFLCRVTRFSYPRAVTRRISN